MDLFRCESILLRSHWVLVVIDVFTRRIVGFGIGGQYIDGPAVCRMFNHAIVGHAPPARISTDHDPLFRFHQWLANLRILEVEEIKSVPHVPMSHPFVERVIGTIRREYLDHTFFWNSIDLQRKLDKFQTYTTKPASTAPSTAPRPRIAPETPHLRKRTWSTTRGYGIATDYSKLPSPLDWEFAPHRTLR